MLAPAPSADTDYEFTAASWPDTSFGRQVFKPGELILVKGKLVYKIEEGPGLR